MATLTIRNVPPRIVKSLKSLARKKGQSMEQEVRELLEDSAGDRLSVLEQLETAWEEQSRRPTAGEVETWIRAGRE
jgi:plasmid stability protein